ncbi:MAG: hypothetical protein JXB14_08175 [Candidatus Altiarchaeota archaeon]|nr:hypothetical protein [Candidatus Altiarchaeota archaeon]
MENRLNIGCGIIYNPGKLNIDSLDNAVADLIAKAEDLPFDSEFIEHKG